MFDCENAQVLRIPKKTNTHANGCNQADESSTFINVIFSYAHVLENVNRI